MILLDTSVFIASFIKEHIHHSCSIELISQVYKKKYKACVSPHVLAECYATLTVIPQKESLSTADVLVILRKYILDCFQIIPLNEDDYRKALDCVASKNLKSGSIFDALIFQTAVKVKVDSLITWNTKHFNRFLSENMNEIKVMTPSGFLG